MNLKNIVLMGALVCAGWSSCIPQIKLEKNTNEIIFDSEIFHGDLDESIIKKIRKLVSEETVSELSDLVLSHPYGTAEGGGVIYAGNKRLVFYESPNLFSNIIQSLQEINPCERTAVNYMIFIMNENFNGSNRCNAQNISGWREEISVIKQGLYEALENNTCAEAALSWLKSGLSNLYRRESYFIGTPSGEFLGYVHTHNNPNETGYSSFSDIDICVSSDGTYILVTHNYVSGEIPDNNAGEKFQLEIARRGITKVIGEYEIPRDKILKKLRSDN